jgi:hypothetical protein
MSQGNQNVGSVASVLDPRMKGGVEISDADKEIIYDNI